MATQDQLLVAKILELLDEHQTMAVSTLRSDGWPQSTMVLYAHDGLTLYFPAAITSQKVENISRDGRVSIALGHEEPTRVRGLSLAAFADIVDDPAERETIIERLGPRNHRQFGLAPGESGSVMVRATPMVISIIDHGKGPEAAEFVSVVDPGSAQTLEARSGAIHRVIVHTVRSYERGYRTGAPP